MTDAGEQVRVALERRRQSVETAYDAASALAERRENQTPEAPAVTVGSVPAGASPNEGNAA